MACKTLSNRSTVYFARFGNQLASSTHFLFAGEIGIIFTSEGCFDDSKFQGFQIISCPSPRSSLAVTSCKLSSNVTYKYEAHISCHLGNTKCYAQAVSTDTKVCRVWMSFTTSHEGMVTKGGDGKPSKNRQWCLTMNRSTSSQPFLGNNIAGCWHIRKGGQIQANKRMYSYHPPGKRHVILHP